MMGKVLDMLGFRNRREEAAAIKELDRKIQEQRQLTRLAKSELIENVFQGLSDSVSKGTGRR